MSEFKDMKDNFNNIEVPSEIDFVIAAAMKKGKKHRIHTFFKPAVIAAACIIAFVISVNVSPAFANILYNIPGLSNFIELVNFDKGIKAAIDNGLVREINKSAEDKGIKFTINRVILDKRSLVIEYSIEAIGDYTDLRPEWFEIKGVNGKILNDTQGGYMKDDGKFMDTKRTTGVIVSYLANEIKSLPDEIIIKIDSFHDQRSNSPSYIDSRSFIDGNWNISISTKDVIITTKPLNYTSKKDINIEYMKFNIDDIKVYPTVTDVKIKFDTNNTYEFVNFKNPRLEDELGNVYKLKWINSTSDDEHQFQFESSFFTKPKKLYFKSDGIYCIPKENKYIIVDFDNKRVTANDYYNIEYLSHELEGYKNTEKHTKNYGKQRYNLELTLVIKDKDIITEVTNGDNNQTGIGFGSISDDIYNLITQSNYKQSINDDGFINVTISMQELTHIPHTLKIEIFSAAKGILKPISIELKR